MHGKLKLSLFSRVQTRPLLVFATLCLSPSHSLARLLDSIPKFGSAKRPTWELVLVLVVVLGLFFDFALRALLAFIPQRPYWGPGALADFPPAARRCTWKSEHICVARRPASAPWARWPPQKLVPEAPPPPKGCDTKKVHVESRCRNRLSQARPQWRYSRSERCLPRVELKSSPSRLLLTAECNECRQEAKDQHGDDAKRDQAYGHQRFETLWSWHVEKHVQVACTSKSEIIFCTCRTYQCDNCVQVRSVIEALVTRRNSPRSGRENSVWNSSFTLPTPPQSRSSFRGLLSPRLRILSLCRIMLIISWLQAPGWRLCDAQNNRPERGHSWQIDKRRTCALASQDSQDALNGCDGEVLTMTPLANSSSSPLGVPAERHHPAQLEMSGLRSWRHRVLQRTPCAAPGPEHQNSRLVDWPLCAPAPATEGNLVAFPPILAGPLSQAISDPFALQQPQTLQCTLLWLLQPAAHCSRTFYGIQMKRARFTGCLALAELMSSESQAMEHLHSFTCSQASWCIWLQLRVGWRLRVWSPKRSCSLESTLRLPCRKLVTSSARKSVQADIDSSMAGYSKMLKDLWAVQHTAASKHSRQPMWYLSRGREDDGDEYHHEGYANWEDIGPRAKRQSPNKPTGVQSE